MSDLISRNKIYNYIKAQINPYGKPFEGDVYEFGIKLMEYIEQMNTEESVTDTNIGGKWIPCSEELPKKSGKYLVTIREGLDVHTTVRRFNPKPKHPEQNKPVFTKHVPYYSGWERATRGVVAWCSLPEPYKGE